MRLIKCYGKRLIMKELKKSYNFFIKEVNLNKSSKGFGLIRDKTLLANHIARHISRPKVCISHFP